VSARLYLDRAQLTYVLDREAFEQHWSTLGEAIRLQARRAAALHAADALRAGGFTVYAPTFDPIVVPGTVLQLIEENP
jgi:hypothetical protein